MNNQPLKEKKNPKVPPSTKRLGRSETLPPRIDDDNQPDESTDQRKKTSKEEWVVRDGGAGRRQQRGGLKKPNLPRYLGVPPSTKRLGRWKSSPFESM